MPQRFFPAGVVPFTRSLTDNTLVVADGVSGLRSVMVNVYFVRTADDGWVLIDTGLPNSAAAIRTETARLFGDTPPRAILLTHAHSDHSGSAKTLTDAWDVPVYAHPMAHPFLSGGASYPPPDPWAGGVISLLSPLFPRTPIDLGERLRPLPSGGEVPFLDDWRWLHTPGHSPGHVSFWREADRTLVAGDAFVTTKQESLLAVLAQSQAVYGPPKFRTDDWPSAAASVRTLADLSPETAACGHGTPMTGERLREQLNRLADSFDRVAVPAGGRYAEQPVVYDEHGPERVPAAKPVPKSAVVFGVAAAIGIALGAVAAAAAYEVGKRDEA